MEDIRTTFEYQESFVAFLDILGFKEKVLKSRDRAETLKLLVDSLNICGAFSSGGKKTTEDGVIPIQSRFFSDSVVFFTKQESGNLRQLFFLVRYLQDRLWEKGICLRGAITLGEMYWPEEENEVTVGPALMKAYELEKYIAIYPRILVSQELYNYILSDKIKANPFGRSGELKDFIQKDGDGVYFLDLLNEKITRAQDEELIKYTQNSFAIKYAEDNGKNYSEILSKVNTIIRDNINSEDEKKRQKYEWLKSYMEKT